MGELEKVITGFIIFISTVVGLLVGWKLRQNALASKARQLHMDVQASYPREAVLWHHGYKRALLDLFDVE